MDVLAGAELVASDEDVEAGVLEVEAAVEVAARTDEQAAWAAERTAVLLSVHVLTSSNLGLKVGEEREGGYTQSLSSTASGENTRGSSRLDRSFIASRALAGQIRLGASRS